MKPKLFLTQILILIGFYSTLSAQINIKVKVNSIAVLNNLDCDAGGSDNSDFVFEYKIQDNSPASFTNNSPVAGSIGMCNYVVINEQNGPYNLTPSTPGAAVFSPTSGVFFDRNYNCINNIPTSLTLTWAAYENDDATAPSTTPVANGIIAPQITTYTVPSANGTFTTQFTQTSSDGACPQTYVIEFEIEKSVGTFSPLTLGVPETNVICTGASTGHVEVDATGGSGTVLYDWSIDGIGDFDDNAMETGLMAGTYTLVVKDALNCTDTSIVTIFSTNTPLNISSFTAATASVCTNQTGIIYSVPTQTNVVFYWNFSGPGGVINGTGNAITMNFLSFANNGTLSVYAQNSCSVSPTLTLDIIVQQSPTITISGNNTVCNNAQEVLTASGAATYSWNTGATTSSIVVTPSVTTVYSVTGTGANSCVAMNQYTMNVLSSPTVQINGSSLTVCPHQTVAISAVGNGNLFIWSDGFIGANHAVSASATTIYTVTNTYTNSCFTQVTYTLNVFQGPALAITGNTILCEGASSTLTATGANTFTWSNGPTTNTNTLTPTAPTTYTLSGTTTDGCVDSITKFINVVASPTVTISGADSICKGKFVTLTASANGIVTYAWNSGANTSTINVSPISNFTYVVTADNGGCSASTSHEVYVKLIPSIDFSIVSPPLCSTDGVYTFTANPSGGLYTGTGVTADTFDPSVGIGIYPITYEVTTSNGCLASETQTIEVMLCTGINDADNNTFKVFPNPASDFVMIQSDKEMKSVLVYDYSGKLVRMIETTSFETRVDMNALAKGFYSLTITLNDHSQKTIKVIKE